MSLINKVIEESKRISSLLGERPARLAGLSFLLVVVLLVYSLFGSHILSSAPTNFSNSGPKIRVTQRYLNRTFLTNHTTEAFDSSGGDLIVVCASSHSSVTMTPSDSFNNTWTSGVGPTSNGRGFDLRTAVWYAKTPKVGPGHTFTLNLSTPQSLVISIFVVSGSNPSDPIDAVSTIGDDAGLRLPRADSPSITTTTNDDLLIGFAKSATAQTWKSGYGYTQQTSASSNYLDAETGFAETPGRYRSTFDLSSWTSWQAIVLAVKPAPNRQLVSSH